MADSSDPSSFYAKELAALDALGPRLTGSPSHHALINRIVSTLESYKYAVHRDSKSFKRWSCTSASLRIGDTSVPISAAYPYSGEAAPPGITAPLKKLGGFEGWGKAKGCIAVVECGRVQVPSDLLFGTWQEEKDMRKMFGSVVIDATLGGPKLAEAKKAGVAGVVVVWRGMESSVAKNQYLPFTAPYAGIPAVWVAEEVEKIMEAAKRGESATLVLDAEVNDATVDTVWAVSKGTDPSRTILVTTHTDGTNSVEENGHIGVLELARRATLKEHCATYVFAFVGGHMRIPAVVTEGHKGQATSAWLEMHPELWKGDGEGSSRAVAGLVLEHLGAKGIGANGNPEGVEMELIYATTPEMHAITTAEWRGEYADKGSIILKPGHFIMFGEGEPLFERGIPSVSLVTAPEYLLAECGGELVDLSVLERQVESFGRILERLDADVKTLKPGESGTTVSAFGVVRHATVSQKLVAAARLVSILLSAKFQRLFGKL